MADSQQQYSQTSPIVDRKKKRKQMFRFHIILYDATITYRTLEVKGHDGFVTINDAHKCVTIEDFKWRKKRF